MIFTVNHGPRDGRYRHSTLFGAMPGRVVAISHAVKDWLVENRTVPREKISVIYYGIDPTALQATRPISGGHGVLRKTESLLEPLAGLELRKGHDA